MEDNENRNITQEQSEERAQESTGKKQPAEKPKKKRGRSRLFDDYQYRDVKNKKGKTVRRKVYTGKHYGYVIPKEYRKNEGAYIRKIKITYVLFLLAVLAVWLIPHFVNAQSLGTVVYAEEIEGYVPPAPTSDTVASAQALFGTKIDTQFFYVLLPDLVCALPMLLIGMTLFEFIFTGGNRHEQAFMEALTKNMRGQTIMLMIAAGITAISDVVFIISNYKVIKSPASEVAVFLLMAAIIGICLLWLRTQAKYVMEEEK